MRQPSLAAPGRRLPVAAAVVLTVVVGGPIFAADRADLDLIPPPADRITPPVVLGGPGNPPPAGPLVQILWFDPSRALPEGLDLVRPEVDGIFHGIGVELRWTLGGLGTVYGESDVPEVPVILLPDDPDRSRRERRVMGLVMRNQEPTRAIWVFTNAVRWTLGHDPRAADTPTEAEREELALAVARVVAHEVVHAIAPDEPHSRKGLMSHRLNRGFLLGRGAPVDTQCAAAFLSRLAALLARRDATPTASLRAAPFREP